MNNQLTCATLICPRFRIITSKMTLIADTETFVMNPRYWGHGTMFYFRVKVKSTVRSRIAFTRQHRAAIHGPTFPLPTIRIQWNQVICRVGSGTCTSTCTLSIHVLVPFLLCHRSCRWDSNPRRYACLSKPSSTQPTVPQEYSGREAESDPAPTTALPVFVPVPASHWHELPCTCTWW